MVCIRSASKCLQEHACFRSQPPFHEILKVSYQDSRVAFVYFFVIEKFLIPLRQEGVMVPGLVSEGAQKDAQETCKTRRLNIELSAGDGGKNALKQLEDYFFCEDDVYF